MFSSAGGSFTSGLQSRMWLTKLSVFCESRGEVLGENASWDLSYKGQVDVVWKSSPSLNSTEVFKLLLCLTVIIFSGFDIMSAFKNSTCFLQSIKVSAKWIKANVMEMEISKYQALTSYVLGSSACSLPPYSSFPSHLAWGCMLHCHCWVSGCHRL